MCQLRVLNGFTRLPFNESLIVCFVYKLTYKQKKFSTKDSLK